MSRCFFIVLLAAALAGAWACKQSYTVDVPSAVSPHVVGKYEYIKLLKKDFLKYYSSHGQAGEGTEPVVSAPAEDLRDVPEDSCRRALVMGNARYEHVSELGNPVNDALGMKEKLGGLGFDVTVSTDAGRDAMLERIYEFGKQMGGCDTVLFYYAGHGVQVNGENYLVPVDARLDRVEDVREQCINAASILDYMESAGCATNIVILDACRDNPFKTLVSRGIKRKKKGGGNGDAAGTVGQGLARMRGPKDTLIAYATSPGKVAYDGAGRKNSYFTAALLKHIAEPDISIFDMFTRVNKEVLAETGNKQTPWVSNSFTHSFYFRGSRKR